MVMNNVLDFEAHLVISLFVIIYWRPSIGEIFPFFVCLAWMISGLSCLYTKQCFQKINQVTTIRIITQMKTKPSIGDFFK